MTSKSQSKRIDELRERDEATITPRHMLWKRVSDETPKGMELELSFDGKSYFRGFRAVTNYYPEEFYFSSSDGHGGRWLRPKLWR